MKCQDRNRDEEWEGKGEAHKWKDTTVCQRPEVKGEGDCSMIEIQLKEWVDITQPCCAKAQRSSFLPTEQEQREEGAVRDSGDQKKVWDMLWA